MLRRAAITIVSIAFLWMLPNSGCSKPGSGEDETTTDLRHITRAYGVVIGMKNRPPKDIEELQKVLADLHLDGLNPPPDEVLTSARDNEPYVVIMGANLGGVKSGDILAYEKKGADGKRYVLDLNYQIRQLTDKEFAEATFAQGHKPTGG